MASFSPVTDVIQENITSFTILYGSETGTAEDVAFQLCALIESRFEISVIVRSCDEYDIAELVSQQLIIFIVSTTGDGEIPSNMRKFWRFLLQKKLNNNSLIKLKYAVFGLGDSSYDKYNAAARKLQMRLKQLGSQDILPIGLGDDQSRYGYLTALDPWVENIVSKLYSMGLKLNEEGLKPNIPLYKTVLNTNLIVANTDFIPSDSDLHGSVYGNTSTATVTLIKRLTNVSWHQDVRHFVFQLDTAEFSSPSFLAGDVVKIYPCNFVTSISRALKILQRSDRLLTLDTRVTILKSDIRKNCRNNRINGSGITMLLETILGTYLDICGMPQRSFFQSLASFVSNEDQKEKLIEISSAAGNDIYFNYCVKERRNYIDVLEDFHSACPPLDFLLEVIPLIRPRSYSIASTSLVNNREIHVCVALVEYKTKLGRKIEGICSQYLKNITVGTTIRLILCKGAFNAPEVNKKIILIGPGTGVAPMRAIIEERLHLSPHKKIHNFLLFFGCRKQNCDYLYEDEFNSINESMEINTILNNAVLSTNSYKTVVTAFSQDQPQKVYVTDKLKLVGDSVWKALLDGCYIYIAGSAKNMPKDVRKAIQDIIVLHGNLSVDVAIEFLKKMDRDKRYIVDCW